MAGSVSSRGRSTPVGAHDERCGVPGAGELKQAPPGAEQPEQHRDEALGAGVEIGLFEQARAQLLERLAGARRPRELAAVHRGLQDVLGDEGHGHRFDALAGDVADGERENARRAAVVVDEVAAAEHAGAGRAVREGDVEAFQLWWLLGQQATLQTLGDVDARGAVREEKASLVGRLAETQRRRLAERGEQPHVALAEGVVPVAHREKAQRRAACVGAQRHAGEALHPGDAGDDRARSLARPGLRRPAPASR